MQTIFLPVSLDNIISSEIIQSNTPKTCPDIKITGIISGTFSGIGTSQQIPSINSNIPNISNISNVKLTNENFSITPKLLSTNLNYSKQITPKTLFKTSTNTSPKKIITRKKIISPP